MMAVLSCCLGMIIVNDQYSFQRLMFLIIQCSIYYSYPIPLAMIFLFVWIEGLPRCDPAMLLKTPFKL